jgi:hypothetical protein
VFVPAMKVRTVILVVVEKVLLDAQLHCSLIIDGYREFPCAWTREGH